LSLEHKILTSELKEGNMEDYRRYTNSKTQTWVRKQSLIYEIVRNLENSWMKNESADLKVLLGLINLLQLGEEAVQLNAAVIFLLEKAITQKNENNQIDSTFT
jgi:hypothetical protein